MKVISKICSIIGIVQKDDIVPFVQVIKPEQHPESIKTYKSIIPDGQTMDEWFNGGWAKFNRDENKTN